MNSTGRCSIVFAIAAFIVFSGRCLSAEAATENYQRALSSTAWILARDAENEMSSGTGVCVDADQRLVLTNAHLVAESRRAVVFFPVTVDDKLIARRDYYLNNVLKLGLHGDVVALDRKRDLALIQLPSLPRGVRAIEVAETSPRPGLSVDLVGNPGNSEALWVYSSGTVRSVYQKLFRSDHGEHDFMAVETQSPIRPGDSGGPVLDPQGTLVAIAQSFSPQSPTVGYCVDATEIRKMLKSPWRSAAPATRVLLERAGIAFRRHASGHYQLDRTVEDKTQSVFVAKRTEYHDRADIRRVWSTAWVSPRTPEPSIVMRLMRQNAATKIGAWAVEETASGYGVFFVAKVDATATDDTLESVIDYVARITAAMKRDLAKPRATEATSPAIASWLADQR